MLTLSVDAGSSSVRIRQEAARCFGQAFDLQPTRELFLSVRTHHFISQEERDETRD
jgi:hypothetical protein